MLKEELACVTIVPVRLVTEMQNRPGHDDRNPLPDTVTVSPTSPEFAVSTMFGPGGMTSPVNVCSAVYFAGDPVAVTRFEAPPLLNVKPLPAAGVNVHVPPPEPPLTVIAHRRTEVGPVTAIEVSVDANPEVVAVTVTPVGPARGVRVRLGSIPVNVVTATSIAPPLFPVPVTLLGVPALLNENPATLVALNIQVPPPEAAGEIVIVQRVGKVALGPVTAIEMSIGENQNACVVTVTPVGPEEGVSVKVGRLTVMIPVVAIAVAGDVAPA